MCVIIIIIPYMVVSGQYSCSKVLKYALDHPLLAESRKKKTKSKIKREVPVAATLGTTGDYLKTKVHDEHVRTSV